MKGGAEMVFGRHVLMELYGCSYKTLSDLDFVKKILIDLATRLGSRILSEYFVRLNPGISGILIIGESHISIHTWPEKNYASLDIYTCNTNSDLKQAILFIEEMFSPTQRSVLLVERGLPKGFRVSEIISNNPQVPEMVEPARE
ncbi:MAG: adenosylmethionine decarboxylase [Thermoprotei archaeon]